MTKRSAGKRLASNMFRPEDWLPRGLGVIEDHQTALPRIAKDKALLREIEDLFPAIPTRHHVVKTRNPTSPAKGVDQTADHVNQDAARSDEPR